jgi:ABC-type multidrug transport system ATPase subunit
LRAEGAIVILATHDLDLADGLLDSALFLRDGRMVDTVARPDALRSTYRTVMGRTGVS